MLLELCDAGLSLGLCPDLHLHARERGGRGEGGGEEKGGRERDGEMEEERGRVREVERRERME